MTRFLASLALVAAMTAPASADDERSEHTAALVGADADKLGVTMKWDDKAGWSMDVRAKPGANVITTQLTALGKDHVHYLVYVAPGRESIAFVEISAGRAPTAKDTMAWVYSPDGKLLRSWTFGAVVDAKDLKASHRSISHYGWSTDGFKHTKAGIEFTTHTSKRTIVLAADATTLRRQ